MAIGSTATWMPKKRVSVAPVTSSPPRSRVRSQWPASGTLLTMSVPMRVAKNDSSFHGSR